MSKFRFSRGMKITLNNLEYVIEEKLNKGQLRLLNKNTDERRCFKESELIDAYFEGNLKILGYFNESRKLDEKIDQVKVIDFTALDDTDSRKQKALRKLKYLRELIKNKKTGFSNKEIRNVIQKVADEIGDLNPPVPRTLRRWLKTYIESGEDIRSLIDANKSKGNYNRKFSDDDQKNIEILFIIELAIKEIFLNEQQNPVQAAFDNIEYRINEINKTRCVADRLTVPDKSSVYRIVSRLDEYEVDKARLGKRFADEKHKTHQKNPEPTRPLERVECDDTRVDLMVVDSETLLPLGRPWLMILIDVFSKMILGYFLSFVPPSHTSVMMAMKHAIRPKSYLKDKYPEVVNSWDSYGVIETLVIDNAKHWYGRGLEDACYQLGTDMQFAPVKIPWFKGSVERLLRTINTGLLHKQPGTTFSNIFEKMDYDPKKHAVITLDLLNEILHKWIVDIYSQQIHRGIKAIPAKRWESGISKYPPALPPAHTQLEILLGKIEYRKISGTVIHFKNLEYSDSILSTIRQSSKDKDAVKIKYDPTDLGFIYVFDSFKSQFIPVPAVDQEYARGLTEWQHEIICRFVRQTNQAQINRPALAEAKEYIRRRIAEALSGKARKIREANKIARWMTFEEQSEAKLMLLENNPNSNFDQNFTKRKDDLAEDAEDIVSPDELIDEPLEFAVDEQWTVEYNSNEEEL